MKTREICLVLGGLLGFSLGCSRTGPAQFGVEARSSTTKAPRAVFLFSVPVISSYVVTLDRIDLSKNGEEWTTVLFDPVQLVGTGEGVEVTVDRADKVPRGEYHGVRAWFGKRLGVWGNITTSVGVSLFETYSGGGYYEDWDRDNPVLFTTKNGKLPFPFTIDAEGSRIILSFDFSKSFILQSDVIVSSPTPSFGPTMFKIDPNPAFRPTITVRVTKFRG